MSDSAAGIPAQVAPSNESLQYELTGDVLMMDADVAGDATVSNMLQPEQQQEPEQQQPELQQPEQKQPELQQPEQQQPEQQQPEQKQPEQQQPEQQQLQQLHLQNAPQEQLAHNQDQSQQQQNEYNPIDKIKQIQIMPELTKLLLEVNNGTKQAKDFDKLIGGLRLKISKLRQHVLEIEGIEDSPESMKAQIEKLKQDNQRKQVALQEFKEKVDTIS